MKKNAKKGNAYSQYCLAKSYIEGIKPFKQNYQKYIFWLEKASEQDMADAQYELAFIYYRGIETPAEYRNKAISLLKKAAENGKDEAALSLGKMYGYQYTDEFPQDREQSLYWFEFAAEAGNAEAMQNLYDIYKSGIWVPKDMQKALYYLTMSSEDSSSALNKLGECYFNGKEVSRNYEKAFKLFQKNCNGDWYYTQTRNEALYKLQSLYWLGVCYENGFGTEKNEKKALESYEMAAAKNISMACDRLGMIYKEGNLVTQNLEKAIELLKLAAEELHYEMAQYHLAMCFFNGDGVKKDLQKAAELFDKSARQYCAEAQYMLGLCRENGWGIKFSLKQAKKMYEKAAEQGYGPAVEKLKQMNQSG